MPSVLLVPEWGLYLAFRLPMLFKSAGWDVDVLCLAGDPVAHSRHVKRSFRERTSEALLARLQSILRDRRSTWQAVIVAHEGIVRRLLATGDSDLLERWQPGARNPQVREFLLSKFGLAGANKTGLFTMPSTRICQTVAELEEFGGEVGWPIIVKPPDLSGGKGVVKYSSAQELASAHATPALPMLAQKYIQGRRGVVDMLCSAGRPLAWLSSYSTKRIDGEFGGSTARLFCPMPKLQPMVEAVARFTRFEGFCGFDWIEEEATHRHFLIEFHPRPPSGFRFGRFCGVDFSVAIRAWLNREADTFPTQVQPPGGSLTTHYFPPDVYRCFRERDWAGLKEWLPGSGSCHDMIWDDLPLLAAWAPQRFWRLCKDCLRPAKGNKPGWSPW